MIKMQQQILSVKNNIDQLIRSYTLLKNENENLKKQTDAHRNSLAEQNQKIEHLEQQLAALKTAKAITGEGNKEDKSYIRQTVNELIREVDKCIATLNNT